MNVPDDLQQFVGEQMLLGNYESVDDLISEALTLLRDKRRAELFEMIDIGRQQIENGECTDLETEEDVHEFFDNIGRDSSEHTEPAA